MRRKLLSLSVSLLVAITVGMAAPSARADLLLQDGFDDGSRLNGADPLDTNWWKVKEAAPGDQPINIIDDSAGIGTGNALEMLTEGTTGSRPILGSFPAISLLNVGDYVQLTFDFRILGGPPSVDRGFRFGFYNSMGTEVTGDQTVTGPADDDIGYYVRLSTGFNTSATFDKDKGVATLLGGNDLTTLLTDTAFGGILDNGKHTAKIVLTLMEFESSTDPGTFFNGLDVLFTLDEGLPGEKSLIDDDRALETGTTTFNEVAIASYSGGIDFVIDNVNVVGVPEPGMLGLLGLGVLALVSRRRG